MNVPYLYFTKQVRHFFPNLSQKEAMDEHSCHRNGNKVFLIYNKNRK